MTELLIAFLKVLLFYIIIFFIYFVAKDKYNKNKKLGVKFIVLASFLFVIYSYVCTARPFVMDKIIYALKFSSDYYLPQVYNDSIGLWLLTRFLHIFSYNPYFLFNAVVFVYIFITLVAYDTCDESKPNVLLFLLLSEYPFFGFYQLKQCLAISLITLGLVYYFKNEKLKFYILFVFALLFHESSLIVLPVLFLLKLSTKKFYKYMYVILFSIFMILFVPISNYLISFIIKFVPFLSRQISVYLNEQSGISISFNFFTILKGLPYFIIIGFTFLFKNSNFDLKNSNYIDLCLVNCMFIIMSIFMYWFFRFGTYFIFFNCLLASSIYENSNNLFNKKLFKIMLCFVFIVLGVKLWFQYYLIYGGI